MPIEASSSRYLFSTRQRNDTGDNHGEFSSFFLKGSLAFETYQEYSKLLQLLIELL